ncbi:glycosyltransferase family protein [Halococcus sediminicola]|uniref:glycosyl transferase family 2 n=1 Tax=Halococcus sediminicola TaxID=1264579 RepID=UPI0006790E02|nr:glycosyl transferase family 2 [Halococcus sediminicola]
MEYVQERITTLHGFADEPPAAPTDRTAVVVPMTGREYRTTAAANVFSSLATLDVATVVVALRASRERVGAVARWLSEFDCDIELLWCGGSRLETLLAERGLDGEGGKGRDVWLALGLASDHEFVVVHDADALSYSAADVSRLCAPLTNGFEFVKGYYARIEQNQLFGRLFRLFYAPLVATLRERHDAPVLEYLGAFRYALAGEVALTGDLARDLRLGRSWGLEIDTLETAFEGAGFANTAQVDLGIDVHDHRTVSGSEGLAAMSREVGRALLRAVEKHNVQPDYDTLPERYRQTAARFIRQYAADAAHNGFEYDPAGEREQVGEYATAITAPAPDDRLPAWTDAPLAPHEIREVVRTDLAAIKD